jgi:hypothetical protein
MQSFKPVVDPDRPDAGAVAAEQTFRVEQALARKFDRSDADGKNLTAPYTSQYEGNDSSDDIPSAIPASNIRRFPNFPSPFLPEAIPSSPAFTENTLRSIRQFLDTYFSHKNEPADPSKPTNTPTRNLPTKKDSRSTTTDDRRTDSEDEIDSIIERVLSPTAKYDYCHARYEWEKGKCNRSAWLAAHPDYKSGCIERAAERRTSCIRNGGTPSPDEPPEWRRDLEHDEETWFNYDYRRDN